MGPPESEPPWPSGTPGCKWCSTTACYIQGSGKLQLYYWPSPTTATRDMCTDSPGKSHYDPWQSGNYFNTSYTPTTTGSSAVVDGRTFYQGNVYLYIPAASVTNNCQSAVGKVHSDIMLTVAPSDIYTARNDRLGIYPVDYADFNDPVPWSAYKGALQDCASGMNFKPGPWCTKSVVFQEQFHPILNLPISMQHVDPEWAGCKPVMALMDPPVALSAAQLFSTLTTVNPPVETPPQPVDSPTIAATQTRNLDSNGNPDRPGMSGPGKLPEAHTSSGQYVPTPVVTIGPTIISADLTGGVVVDPGITVSKGVATTVSGTAIVVDNNGVTISSPAGSTVISLDQGQVEPLTIASQLFTIDGNDNLVAVPTQLNQADLPVTIDGSIVSIGDTAITILDPQTGKIQTVAFGAAIGADQITLGSETLTLDSSGALVLGPGKTLHVGDAAMTVLGTVISIGEGGITMTEVGIGTSSGTGATSAAGGRGQVQDAVPTESKKGGAERWAVRAGWMIALIITPCMITMA
ncbi:hypothetical protein EJ04DRAFT_516139 [Polyplosphaeria fusca]|uniref:Uncharacterized protein n=1 Tax=Polyplosphaeria fusca TaxID=682080 RepID=A0A9P4UYE8_9PLEO|nr:hypothetical protein EJ04DRAFT_516139 [Polyplosphaeria fusca]